MKKEEFCTLLGGIQDEYLLEARSLPPRKPSTWLRWSMAAACLALAVIAAASATLAGLPHQPPIDSPPAPNAGYGSSAPADTPSTEQGIRVSMENVFLNELPGLKDAALRFYDPERYTQRSWDAGDILAYYGEDLAPGYIPQGLTPAPGNFTAEVVFDTDGALVWDAVYLGYYHDYYEDGSPRLTEPVFATKGFSLRVSRIGMVSCCLYLLPEDEVTLSVIEGTAVAFGYRSMSYGPYDPETHEPSGYYDLFTAEFERNGITYQIVCEQLELEELVKVVASILSGESEIILEPAA